VTGSANLDIEEVKARVAEIKKVTNLPVGVGFGVKDSVTAKNVASFADAVVVGSRMVQAIENSTDANLLTNVSDLIAELRIAIDA